MKNRKSLVQNLLAVLLTLLALLRLSALAAPLGNAFTYQGRLTDGGSLVTGSYDLKFSLYDASVGGTLAGTPTSITLAPVLVTNGLFTVTLDFGNTTFSGEARWLEIAVRTNGSLSAHTPLIPRQQVTPAPYALFAPVAATASSVPWTNLTSVPTGFADGSAFWKIGGNSGTSGLNFIGTTDSQPLLFKVNGMAALWLYPNSTSPNIIAGSVNGFALGKVGATVSGGGQSGFPNLASGNFTTVSGGAGNQAAEDWATIGGGFFNQAGAVSTVAGGSNNFATASFASIAGGIQNSAGDTAAVGGGQLNNASGFGAVISGGVDNLASGSYAMVAGGHGNTASGFTSLAAGYRANATHDGSFVWADSTFATFASTANDQFLIRAAGGVGIGTNAPTALLDVAGPVRARGLLRSGSESGTDQPPSPAGVVVRRINSTITSAGSVVARTDHLTLERDGSAGGFQIRYSSSPGVTTIACMGMNSLGTQINFYTAIDPSGSGTVPLYNNSQNIVHFECTFGRTYNSGQHLTQVTLSRFASDTYWSGTLTSTYDQ
jgi:hypothetical protein